MPFSNTARGALSVRQFARTGLGAAMILAGIGHLSFARADFQAQVPDWVPLDKDTTVLASGVVEIALGGALIVIPPRRRRLAGAALAAFYVAIFPGNIAQYTGHRSSLGLDTDRKRAIRLVFQPALVALAWWSTHGPDAT